MAEIKVATDANFEELVLKAERPVVVDFWAAWCGPCKMVAPEMEKLAEKYDGAVDVVKVDVDANPRLSQAFNILSIPTIAFFQPGAQPQGVVGLPAARAARAAVQPRRVRDRQGRLTRSSSSRDGPGPQGSGPFDSRASPTVQARSAERRAAPRTRATPRRGRRRGRRASAGANRTQSGPRSEADVSGVRRAAAATAGSSAELRPPHRPSTTATTAAADQERRAVRPPARPPSTPGEVGRGVGQQLARASCVAAAAARMAARSATCSR